MLFDFVFIPRVILPWVWKGLGTCGLLAHRIWKKWRRYCRCHERVKSVDFMLIRRQMFWGGGVLISYKFLKKDWALIEARSSLSITLEEVSFCIVREPMERNKESWVASGIPLVDRTKIKTSVLQLQGDESYQHLERVGEQIFLCWSL